MKNTLLVMSKINKSFPGVTALRNVDFSLEAGEIHALLGENGAGKSTLIKVLTGVEPYDEGTINFDGKSIRAASPFHAQHLGISTVYQEVNLCSNLSVAENIYVGREPMKGLGIDWAKMKSDAKELLKRFHLDIDVTATLDHYSIAVQQMVAIARAVDISAKVLILDEPTSSLSLAEVETLFDIMRMLKKQGMGIVFVTHFLDQVYEISDRMTVLRNGELVGTYCVSELSRIQLVSKMIGKEYVEFNKKDIDVKQRTKKNVLLRTRDLTSGEKIGPITFDVYQGEVLGLAGLQGSGRTETVNLLFGALKKDNGEIMIHGKCKGINKPIDAIRSSIALCPEDRKVQGIVSQLSVRDNIVIALQAQKGIFKKIKYKDAKALADQYIKALQIKTPSHEQTIGNLSGGNQQKVILGRWLATKPELLMLDEPTRGIDIGTKAEIQKIVLDLADEGIAVIFVSSELDEELQTCGRMLIYKDRRIVAEIAGDEINESTVMEAMAGGEAHAG